MKRKKYSVNGTIYTVKESMEADFLVKFPNAVLVEEQIEENVNFPTGTPECGCKRGACKSRANTRYGITLGRYFFGVQEDKYAFEEPFQGTFFGDVVLDFFGDIGRAFESGVAAGTSVDEAFEIYKKRCKRI